MPTSYPAMEAALAYDKMYGVKRTTIYLTDLQKQLLEAVSARTTRTEADLIREGVDHVLDVHRVRSRKPGVLFSLADPVLDDPARVDEALAGFGES
jgi:Ribbon-helix-helix domain